MNTLQETARKCRILSGVIASYKNPVIPVLDRLRLLPKRETIVSLRNGLRFRVRTRTSDLQVVNEIFVHNVYAPVFERITPKPEIIGVDIGAHIGTFTALAATRFPRVKMYSFEPSPENYRLLQENIRLNSLRDRVIAVNSAICRQRGEAKLLFAPNDSGGGSLYGYSQPDLPQTSCNVTTVTLQDVFDTYGLDKVDLLKVDCEGGEYEIFYSAPVSYIERISEMIVEYHTHIQAGWAAEKDRLKLFLRDSGFMVEESERYSLLYVSRR